MKQNKLQSLSHQELWAKAQDYFKSIDDHNRKAVKLMPYTQKGIAKYFGLSYHSWLNFKDANPDLGYGSLGHTIKYIILKIEVHQLEGAMIGVFRPGILNKWFEKQGK